MMTLDDVMIIIKSSPGQVTNSIKVISLRWFQFLSIWLLLYVYRTLQF